MSSVCEWKLSSSSSSSPHHPSEDMCVLTPTFMRGHKNIIGNNSKEVEKEFNLMYLHRSKVIKAWCDSVNTLYTVNLTELFWAVFIWLLKCSCFWYTSLYPIYFFLSFFPISLYQIWKHWCTFTLITFVKSLLQDVQGNSFVCLFLVLLKQTMIISRKHYRTKVELNKHSQSPVEEIIFLLNIFGFGFIWKES